jgi:hypothetical protein
MSNQLIVLCFLGVLFLFPFICQFGCASIQKQSRRKSGQVGMYIYRNKTVKGYEQYDSLGRLMSKMLIQRDGDGNMISRVSFDGSEAIVKRFEYDVNKNGLMEKKTRFTQDDQMSWYAFYKYDAAGRRIEQCNYDRQDSLTTRVTFYYDSHGERIRNEVYDAEGRPIKIHIYLFDARHRRVRDLTVDLNGEILSSTRYIYGDSGFVSRIEYIDRDGGLEGYNEVDCDANGNRLGKKDFDGNGILKSTTRYVY